MISLRNILDMYCMHDTYACFNCSRVIQVEEVVAGKISQTSKSENFSVCRCEILFLWECSK